MIVLDDWLDGVPGTPSDVLKELSQGMGMGHMDLGASSEFLGGDASDTAYRVGIPAQQLTLTHTDGFPIQHTEIDAVVLGMGERIDALMTVKEGFTTVLALANSRQTLP